MKGRNVHPMYDMGLGLGTFLNDSSKLRPSVSPTLTMQGPTSLMWLATCATAHGTSSASGVQRASTQLVAVKVAMSGR